MSLCPRHRGTLHRWREIHHHETKGSYRRRCNTIARQCRDCQETTR